MTHSRKPGPLEPAAAICATLARPPSQRASPFAAGSAPPAPAVPAAAVALSLSAKAVDLLKAVEGLRLVPYDDQTGKDTADWVPGATIGYGHLIDQADWDSYKGGITLTVANDVFDTDALPFVELVRAAIKPELTQNEFDALVILAFNIGPIFAASSVVALINDPAANTGYASLEQAWKAWNKSQGKVMKGLDNRRQCEWNIYTLGVYERW